MIYIFTLFIILLSFGFYAIKNAENKDDDDINFGC
jgi:hypothetical protein